MLAICAGATGLYAGVCIVRGNETFYKYTVMPFIQLLDPESAHKLAVYIAEHRLMPKSRFQDTEVLVGFSKMCNSNKLILEKNSRK